MGSQQIFVQLAFINTTTNTPLDQVPDSNFIDAGINVRVSSNNANSTINITSSTLTTNSVINGTNVNISLYEQAIEGASFSGKWYSNNNSSQVIQFSDFISLSILKQGGTLQNNYGYVFVEISNDEMFTLTMEDGWLLPANAIKLSFGINEMLFNPSNAYEYPMLESLTIFRTFYDVRPLDNRNCYIFIELAIIDTLTSTPFNPTLGGSAGIQLSISPSTNTPACYFNFNTSVLTTQSIINPFEFQLIYILSGLGLTGNWYSADNTTSVS